METWTSDFHSEHGFISVHAPAFGEALSREPRPEGTPRAGRTSTARRTGSQPSLNAAEEALLRIFIARRGQCLSLSSLQRLYAESLHALAARAGWLTEMASVQGIEAVIASLSAKLHESDLRWRVFAMEGCGYVLWH
jgi:hypothetical protein